MTDYVKATDFASKDALLSGNPSKIIKGTEIDTEYNSIATAISTKADLASPTLTGTPLAPTATSGTNTTQIATTAFVQTALQALYPVGSIYINATSSTNPGTLLGFGTWVAFGTGRVMVGLDAGNAAFDTAEETGGSADAIVVSHTHTYSGTTSSNGDHQHYTMKGLSGYPWSYWTSSGQTAGTQLNDGGASSYYMAGGSGTADTFPTNTTGAHTHTYSGTTDSTGSSATNANLQPYIVVRMWKRTA